AHCSCRFFCFHGPATSELYTLSLHDALPISGDDELRVADPEVLGSAPGLVVPLAAAAPAELPRPSPTAGHLEAAAAPAAPSQLRPPVPCTHHRLYFRHSDEITVTRRCGRYRASGAGARLPARLDAAPAARRARLRPDAAED